MFSNKIIFVDYYKCIINNRVRYLLYNVLNILFICIYLFKFAIYAC